jgi:hypothetical protein
MSAASRAAGGRWVAERCVKTLRHEVLDWTLVLGRRHLDPFLRRYERHSNEQRAHRGLALAIPAVRCSFRPGSRTGSSGRTSLAD